MDDTIPQDIVLKQCSRCQQLFPPTRQFFQHHKWEEDGLSTLCRDCLRIRQSRTFNFSTGQVIEDTPRRICKQCGKSKLATEYQGRYSKVCLACRRDSRQYGSQREKSLIWAYGITQAEYEAMLTRQFGLCAICGQLPKEGQRLHVDHCHKTGLNRDLLCHFCNHMLGNARESVETLENAIKYLKKHSM